MCDPCPATSDRGTEPRHLPALDGIRGLAILAVMVFHADARLLPGGFLGVDVFFVLSGFLITRILLGEFRATGRIRLARFYARRALRLLPALVLLLVCVLLFSAAFLGPRLLRTNATSAALALFYSMNWAMAFRLHPLNILMHTWSLSIEEQFYMLWPAAVAIFLWKTGSGRLVPGLALIIAGASTATRIILVSRGAPLDRTYAGLDVHASGLLLGCALGAALSGGSPAHGAEHGSRWKSMQILGFVSIGGLVFLALRTRWEDPAVGIWAVSLAELFSAVLVLAASTASGGPLARLLESLPLTFTGRISYGLYLWHFPIDFLLQRAGFPGGEVLALGSLLSFAFATASFYLVERPFLSLKDRLAWTAAGS